MSISIFQSVTLMRYNRLNLEFKLTTMKKWLKLLSVIAITATIAQSCVHNPNVEVSTNNENKNDSVSIDTSTVSVNMETQSIESSKSNYIIANIIFPAGKIQLMPGKTNLINGKFKFTNKDWKPVLTYSESNDTGKISICSLNSKENINFENSDTCHWFIDFNPEKKYDFEIIIGAGKGDLNLEGFKIQNFNLELGAGKVNLNLKNTSVPNLNITVGAGKAIVYLTGIWNNNLKAKIAGGVDEIEVHLPKEIGVKAEVNGLLGNIVAEGFSKKHNFYTNNYLGKTKYTLDLEIDGAIGKVKLILE